ncbi:hypothetical protein MTsN2n6_00450 [Vibrio fortis]
MNSNVIIVLLAVFVLSVSVGLYLIFDYLRMKEKDSQGYKKNRNRKS